MERILFISSRPLYPILGGDQIRTVQQLEFLKERYLIDIVYFCDTEHSDHELVENKNRIGKIYRFKINKWRHILQTLRFLFNHKPLQVNYYYNLKTAKFINRLLLENDYFAVFCNNIRTAEYAKDCTHVIKYIDFVDAISMNYEKAKQEAKGLKKIIYSIDCKRCQIYEQECLNKFDSCSIISEIDQKYILSWHK